MDRLLVAVVTDGFALSAALGLLLGGAGLLADRRARRRPPARVAAAGIPRPALGTAVPGAANTTRSRARGDGADESAPAGAA